MIKLALSNIPVNYMSLYRMPHKVMNIIERYQRDFLWEGGSQKNDHLEKWEIVVDPIENGGLSLRRTKERNLKLLGKWL